MLCFRQRLGGSIGSFPCDFATTHGWVSAASKYQKTADPHIRVFPLLLTFSCRLLRAHLRAREAGECGPLLCSEGGVGFCGQLVVSIGLRRGNSLNRINSLARISQVIPVTAFQDCSPELLTVMFDASFKKHSPYPLSRHHLF